MWWSGLATADAKRGFEACRAASEAVDGLTYWSVESSASGSLREATAHLLPIYDEYLVAYRDRVAGAARPIRDRIDLSPDRA